MKRGNWMTVSGSVTNIGEGADDEVVNLNDTSEAAGVEVDLAQRHRERGYGDRAILPAVRRSSARIDR
jgi:hypothetical protein